MPRIPLLPQTLRAAQTGPDSADPVPALHRLLGYNNDLLRAWKQFTKTMRDDCRVSRALRELVILRAGQLGTSDFMWFEHLPMAVAAGVTQEQINELAEWPNSSAFTSKEQSVLRMTEAIALGALTEAEFLILKEDFEDQEIVELVMTAAFFGLVPRFTQALDLRPETTLKD